MMRSHPYLVGIVLLLWTCAALAAGAAVAKTRPAKMHADPPPLLTSEGSELLSISVPRKMDAWAVAEKDAPIIDDETDDEGPCWQPPNQCTDGETFIRSVQRYGENGTTVGVRVW
jgi:hypothetical protein